MKRPDVEAIAKLHLERSDSLDASSYDVYDLCRRILALESDHRAMREALDLIEPYPANWPGYENADGEEIGTRVLAVLRNLRVKDIPEGGKP